MLKASRSSVLVNIVSGSLYDLPTPSSLSYCWNFGSLLGVFLGIQFLSGVFLSFHYSCGSFCSFDSLVHIMRDVNYGWLMRSVHSNGASFFFLLLYFHMGRGMYYGGYSCEMVWFSGVSLFLLSMLTAFLGYVLPWGQMSFWAATVITSLMSVVPMFGGELVQMLWGGFGVSGVTLVRFFSFHFLFPFVLLFGVILHLYFLHSRGSSNSLGVGSDVDSVLFCPLYVFKDFVGFVVLVAGLFLVVLQDPFVFMDVDNFVKVNPMVTPAHIKPEWYFLFAYAILRSISSKVGGVVALLVSVLLLYFIPFFFVCEGMSLSFYFLGKGVFWGLVFNWLVLTWAGSCVVEAPFDTMGAFVSFNYFLFFLMLSVVLDLEDWVIG